MTSSLTTTTLADVVDLDRYPIEDLDSPRGQDFLARCRADLADNGVCRLEGFMRPSAVATMVEIADRSAEHAFRSSTRHNVYFTPPTPSDAPDQDDPHAALQRSAKQTIPYDRIPADSPVRRIHASDTMCRFLALVLDKETLHRSADPQDAVMIATFHEGDELGWHFDNSDFAVTLMYRESESGGAYEYVPALRSAEHENVEGVREVLRGDASGVVTMPNPPGTLSVFQGRYALHRVTPVTGSTSRVNSVLGYGEQADMRLDDLTRELFYGPGN